MTMADVKWIKITTDIFDDEKILLIESLPDSYAIITCWFKLLCLAGKQNNSGVFLMGRIAYNEKMLATIFRMKEATVTMALQTFEQFGMVEIIDGVITIPNWGKHQNLDQLESKKEYMRNYMKGYREKQKALTSCKTNNETNVSQAEEDKDKELEKEEDKDILPGKKAVKKPSKCKYGEFQNVLLTDSEFEKLAADFGGSVRDKAISFLDAYIEEKGYKSKSHNLAIRRWVVDAVKENESKPKKYNRKEPVPGWMDHSLGDAELEAIQRVLREDPDTAGNNPDIADRAERLKERLGV
jgi:predicted phage replisome organizer